MTATHQDYWERNIKGFSGFYDKGSEENIAGPKALVPFYKFLVFPLEKNVMKKRFKLTTDFIQRNIKPGSSAADIGCGSGIFTKYMVFCGAGKVYALDFTQSALALTKGLLSGEELKKVELICRNVARQQIPKSDVALALGVLPYVEDIKVFFQNVLPFTSCVLFNYLEQDVFCNRVRQTIKALDPRKYNYHRTQEIIALLSAYNFKVTRRSRIGQGYLIEAALS